MVNLLEGLTDFFGGFGDLYPDDDRNEHPENYYVWRTMKDKKVRPKHAEREGSRRKQPLLRLFTSQEVKFCC